MKRPVVTDETELRRLIAYAAARVRTLDELYRTLVRIAVVDLDDLTRVLNSEMKRVAARRASAAAG